MSEDFFRELQKHSDAKLRILNSYVIPWMRKIVLGTQQYGGKCLVIDGFAGKGRYENGSDGSPIILLKNAIDFYEQAEANNWVLPNIYLIFIEGITENYNELVDNIYNILGVKVESDISSNKVFFNSKRYPTIFIACFNDKFKNILNVILSKVPQLIPSFCFIDPFGFSDTPFSLIKRYLQNERAEILLNFIYEETNRFLRFENEKIQGHICEHFGASDLTELKELIDGATPTDRKQIIVKYYSDQLQNNAGAKHVLSFEIRKNGRAKLVLFFATKSTVGLDVMKKAMWGVDDTGSYLFDDRKSNQIEFEFFVQEREEEHVSNLANQIHKKFSGRDKITKQEIDDFVIQETIYPSGRFVTSALKKLESDQRIVDVVKIVPGEKRRPGTYKNVYIKFS